MDHKLRNGQILRHKDLLKYEKNGLSDRSIAKIYGISNTALYKFRLKYGWLRKHEGYRSDKGTSKVDPEEKRVRWNKYMREYRKKHPPKKYVSHRQLLKDGYYD